MKTEPTLADKISAAELAERFQGFLDAWKKLDPSTRGAVLATNLEKYHNYLAFAENITGRDAQELVHPNAFDVEFTGEQHTDLTAQAARQVQIAKAFHLANMLLTGVLAFSIEPKEVT